MSIKDGKDCNIAKLDEFLAKITEDGLKDKLAACKNADDIIALAKELGFDLDAEDIEKLTDIGDGELNAAGGVRFLVKKFMA